MLGGLALTSIPFLVPSMLKGLFAWTLERILIIEPITLLGVFLWGFLATVIWFLVTLNRMSYWISKGDLANAQYNDRLNGLAVSAAVVLGLAGTATSIFNGFVSILEGGGDLGSAREAIHLIFSQGIGTALATTVVGLILALGMDTLKLIAVGLDYQLLLQSQPVTSIPGAKSSGPQEDAEQE